MSFYYKSITRGKKKLYLIMYLLINNNMFHIVFLIATIEHLNRCFKIKTSCIVTFRLSQYTGCMWNTSINFEILFLSSKQTRCGLYRSVFRLFMCTCFFTELAITLEPLEIPTSYLVRVSVLVGPIFCIVENVYLIPF